MLTNTLRAYARRAGLVVLLAWPSPALTQSAAAPRAPDSAAKDEATIRALDAQWAGTYATHDTTVFLRILADDFVMTAGTGQRKDRLAELADVRAIPGMTVDYFRTENVGVRMRDGVAVVFGDLTWNLNGSSSPQRRRYTATYARGDGTWRMIALHIGPAPNR